MILILKYFLILALNFGSKGRKNLSSIFCHHSTEMGNPLREISRSVKICIHIPSEVIGWEIHTSTPFSHLLCHTTVFPKVFPFSLMPSTFFLSLPQHPGGCQKTNTVNVPLLENLTKGQSVDSYTGKQRPLINQSLPPSPPSLSRIFQDSTTH